MGKYSHIVWDWNGTLLDDTDVCVDVMNGMLARRGLPGITPEFYQTVIEFPVVHYYVKLGFDFSVEPFEAISDEFVAGYQARWRTCGLQRGALDCMDALARAGVALSVLSASKTGHLLEQLEHFDVRRRLSAVTGADDHHGRGKIDLAQGHVGAVGADPAKVLFIGDTQHDAEVAERAGADCLLVSYGHYSRMRLEHLGLPVVGNMGEVLEYIL